MPLATVQSKGSDYAAPEGVPLPARLQAVTYRRTQFEYKPHHRAVQEGTAKVGEIGVVEAWRWEFEVVEGDHKGVRLFGETPPKITERNRAGQWIRALLGRDLDAGEDVDTDDLIGLLCQVIVTHQEPRVTSRGSLFHPCPVTDVQASDVF